MEEAKPKAKPSALKGTLWRHTAAQAERRAEELVAQVSRLVICLPKYAPPPSGQDLPWSAWISCDRNVFCLQMAFIEKLKLLTPYMTLCQGHLPAFSVLSHLLDRIHQGTIGIVITFPTKKTSPVADFQTALRHLLCPNSSWWSPGSVEIEMSWVVTPYPRLWQ